jgi:hypothetical protein
VVRKAEVDRSIRVIADPGSAACASTHPRRRAGWSVAGEARQEVGVDLAAVEELRTDRGPEDLFRPVGAVDADWIAGRES